MATPTLKLGGLELPAAMAAVTKFAILAVSGAGKSNTAVVMFEELHAAGYPAVAVDPKGDWWGVRSSGTGKSAGLDVPVFGGLHGDVPLEPTAGALIANLIVDQRLACVLDVSEFEHKAQQSRFLTDLATTLLKRNRDPLHLFLEEADEYLPQRFSSRGGDATAACVGAWQRLVKRGRFRGLGCTLITQRSAALNKDALNQIETLIAMRVTAPLDRKAIEGWVQYHALSAELVQSLSGLGDGEGWVWSPHTFKLMERVQFRRRRTFDSGATPELGTARAPAKLADVDLDAIKEQMADTIARAEADDPRTLRARITELERALARAEKDRPAPEVIHETETVYAVPAALADATKELLAHAKAGFDVAARLVDLATSVPTTPEVRTPTRTTARTNQAPKPAKAQVSAAPQQDTSEGTKLGKAERSILTVLAQHHDGLHRQQLGFLSNYSHKSGNFANALGRLRTLGYINREHPIRATDEGVTALGPYEPLPAGQALYDYWAQRLPKAAREILAVLVDAYPSEVGREELAARTDYSAGSGNFANALGKLRSMELISGFRATDAFMDAIR